MAADLTLSEGTKIDFAMQAESLGNHTLACDIVGSLARKSENFINFRGLKLDNGEFAFFTFSERKMANLLLKDCLFWEISLPVLGASDVRIDGGQASKVSGVSSVSALPDFISNLSVDDYDSVENIARIRRVGLTPEQVILLTVIRKTFFQRGAGRKEEALLRGLGKVASRKTATRILNEMVGQGLLTCFRGDDGTVYVPNRSETARMQQIMDQLTASNDPLWKWVS